LTDGITRASKPADAEAVSAADCLAMSNNSCCSFTYVQNEKAAKKLAAENLETYKKEQQELLDIAKQSAAETASASAGLDALVMPSVNRKKAP
jgi:hypothetical protein